MSTHDLSRAAPGWQAAGGNGAQHRAEPVVSARLAGVLYLAIIALGLFAELGVRSRLIDDGDAAATSANILDSAWLFRMGFAADVVVFLCDVALAVLLFFLFRPVSRSLSAMAAAFRLTQTAIIGLNVLAMFGALLVLEDSSRVGGLGAEAPEALALLALDLHAYGYTLGLTFFGVSTAIIGLLALRSGWVPRLLGILLILAGAGYVADSAAFFLVPGYDGAISPILLGPAIIGEVWFAFWLLLRGDPLTRAARRSIGGVS